MGDIMLAGCTCEVPGTRYGAPSPFRGSQNILVLKEHRVNTEIVALF